MAKAIDRCRASPAVRCSTSTARSRRCSAIQALNKSVANLGVEKAIDQFGRSIHQLTFLGIPVKICDQLTETEAIVS
jgi:hypothetical protein